MPLLPILQGSWSKVSTFPDHPRPNPPHTSRGAQLALVYLLTLLSAASHLSALYLGEGAWITSTYHLLLLKYVVGSADLVAVPLAIVLGYGEVRTNVIAIYRGPSMRQREAEEKERTKQFKEQLKEKTMKFKEQLR